MDKKRLRWACRRGMLELDSLLEPFFDDHFEALSNEQKATFETLLTFQDPDLFTWFIGSESPEEPELQALIKLIKSKVAAGV